MGNIKDRILGFFGTTGSGPPPQAPPHNRPPGHTEIKFITYPVCHEIVCFGASNMEEPEKEKLKEIKI
jgi:hypothetical protein